MHLTQIAIKGFKSFAKKTELEFEPGITMIVGPNGSGKSNVTDAIQWVLGEQSPSALRGSAMQDIIFAGSLNHKALGLSEVTLTLDNSDKSLNLDFSEVTITRRLSRNGENAYYINSTPCRLLDIYELLHDSGLGRQTHSIIGQGKLEEIINSKPEDKRILLEEAAGVLKHKKRKERALRKLISTEENINRAKDILREVDKQIKPLEQQVSKAKSYNKLTNELRDLEIATLVRKLTNVKNRWQVITDKEKGIGDKLKPLEEQLSDFNKNIARHEEKYQKQAATVVEQQKLKEKLNSQHLQLERLVYLHEHKEQSLQDNNRHLKEQISQFESQINIKQAQMNNLNKQLDEVGNEINRIANFDDLAFLNKENAKQILEKLETAITSGKQALESAKARKEESKESIWRFFNKTFSQQNKALESLKKTIKISVFAKGKLGGQNEELKKQLNMLFKEKISLDNSHKTLELDNLAKQRQKCLQKFNKNENYLLLITKFTPISQQLIDCLRKLAEQITTESLDTASIEALKTLREQEKELNQKIKELEARRQQLDVDKGVLKSTLDGLADRIIQDYNLALETALKQYSAIVPDQGRVTYIKQQLADIGPVNAIAEEQFKSLSERRDFLEKQIADLLSSKTSIGKIIRAIDRKIKEKLQSAFEEICVNFKLMFSRLFPGGEAELILTGDDIFESGLEIKAQPYGKSPKKLSLLSGGETALTALALLFAVYHTRPSPFYVLDEVEAALDDINLQRFIRLLKEMKVKTQFIVITHQRRTMEVADCLYGITMQADGISKVVSQKMGKENRFAEPEVLKTYGSI